MSGYNNNARQGYGEYDPYSSQPTNYNQSPNNRYNQDVEQHSQGNYEMNQFNNNQPDPNAILNQCREIDRGIESVRQYVEQIKSLYQRLLSDVDPARESALREQVEGLAENTKKLYRDLVDRVKRIKKMPEAGHERNINQIGRIDRNLKAAITDYQRVQSDFRKESETQMARQYRIVRPDATDEEVRDAVNQSSNQQIFSQALIQSDRRGDVQKVSQMVRQRHEEIQKIERDFVELAEMFKDLDALVIQQEDTIVRIENAGEQVRVDVEGGVAQINSAIDKARARNKKKWICLGIALLIIIIIVVVVVVVVLVNKKN
ncbi:Plasma membrane t-SNARE, secretory vesicle fusion [Myotisia sp. PD_48]|nr:Plasma membrane t-SNARE, secretory vesicle fusion [Myotisia sp. PD_48]